MNNLPLGTEFDSSAPWNEIDTYCPECGSNQLEIVDSGTFKGIKWVNYKCAVCGILIDNEPDYE